MFLVVCTAKGKKKRREYERKKNKAAAAKGKEWKRRNATIRHERVLSRGEGGGGFIHCASSFSLHRASAARLCCVSTLTGPGEEEGRLTKDKHTAKAQKRSKEERKKFNF